MSGRASNMRPRQPGHRSLPKLGSAQRARPPSGGKPLRRAGALTALVGVLIGPLAVLAAKMEFHLEAGDAATTLTEFSRQAKLQLLFDYDFVKGHQTPALDGMYEPEEALNRLLAHSDLRFEFVNPRTLTVTPARRTSPVATGQAPTAERPEPREHPPVHERHPMDLSLGAWSGVLPEVRVTGTILRGEYPVGSQMVSFDRISIEASGVPTLGELLRTVPQAFGGGPSQDTHIGVEAQSNSGLGTGVNLRGLGARATLVLINGRRLAPGGAAGSFVDIENIPLGAVERIDILPDSASALYGADAVGGVVNFVMRDEYTGAETLLRGGTGTANALRDYRLAQIVGHQWTAGHAVLALELFHRDALPAAARRFAMSDLRPYGGGDYDSLYSNPGNVVAGSQTWAIPAGQNGTHLSPADFVAGTSNPHDLYDDTDLTPSQRRWSLYGSGRQQLTQHSSVFADLLFSDRTAAERLGGLGMPLVVLPGTPFYVNPTGGSGPVTVEYNFARDLGAQSARVDVKTTNATVGLDVDAGGSWKVTAYGNFAREKQFQTISNQVNLAALQAALADPNAATAFNPFGDGSQTDPTTLAGIRTQSWFRVSSQLNVANITADGPVAQLPAGALKLALGVEQRDQFFTTSSFFGQTASSTQSNSSRRASALFAELVLPLAGPLEQHPGLQKLELSVAGRYDSYSGVGHATTPKLGLTWSPLQGLALRGTWSRSMRAPTLSDLDESHNVAVPTRIPAPVSSGSGSTSPGSTNLGTLALLWAGSNAGLREEHAESWTAGLDFVPARLPTLTVGLTYFAIGFQDRIQSAALAANLLTDPAYAGIVTLHPTPAQIGYVCSHSTYALGSSAACTTFPATALIDLRLHNAATLITHGLDFNGSYELPSRYGRWRLGLEGTWVMEFSQANGPGLPLVPLLNTQNNPIDLRLRGTLGWQRGGLASVWAVNFTNAYRDVASRPARRVDAWTTVDAQVRYDIPAHNGTLLENVRLELDAQNVFNVNPPFLNNTIVGLGYDQENADPFGRILSVQLRKTW